ncbi:MAG TPA: penicillin-binding transpeptidase domain-containing protein [Streptosporangiaceae bacterium]|nr:penicillin-binding transpeptidase domain-containing protein [Streptosporangiaceae bacterium]
MSSGVRAARAGRAVPRAVRAWPKTRLRRSGAAAVSGLLVASVSAGCFSEPSAMPTVRDFLIAWQVENYPAAAKHTTGEPAAVAAALSQVRDQLDAASMRLGLRRVTRHGDEADAAFEVKVDLGENGEPWNYSGRLHLKRMDGVWKVQWSPSVINPKLASGDRLAVITESQARAPVQDASGNSLLRTVDADIVGVVPEELRDRRGTLSTLARKTKLEADRLMGRVGSAPPKEFLPLLTLQLPDHRNLDAQLRQIEGLRFKRVKLQIAPKMARELVGTLGPATAARLQQVGAPYQPGDTIGVTGLQLLYQRRMAGIPAVRVVATDTQGLHPEVPLAEWRGTPSEPVRTTLEQRYQLSAEQALSRLRVPASLVAVNAPTGRILAVANHGTKGENFAFEGRYPPGMTFSIVSTEPLLQRGQQLGAPAPCRSRAEVGDTLIRNPGRARPKATFQMDFALSCATAFAALGGTLDNASLMTAANLFGIGGAWGQPEPENGSAGHRLVPVRAFSGTFPPPANSSERSLAMIGQGRVLMSPLGMALIAGAVDSGTWRPPQLLDSPEPTQHIDPRPLDGGSVTSLNNLMRQSVQYGAARAANLSGTPVRGVTAVVPYTAGGRQKVVSWFVGSRGDVAFALAIEGKVSAAEVAKLFMSGPSNRR